MNYPNINTCDDVFAVIVTFNPDFPVLEELLASLLPQVGKAIIIDNCSANDMVKWCAERQFANLSVRVLDRNYGIAHAQNIGIDAARASGALYVLLSDQDSKPAENMVHELRGAVLTLSQSGINVGAVGPRYKDPRQENPPPFIRNQGLAPKRQMGTHPKDIVEVDHLIASGCLIPVSVLNKVGQMNGDMFIDYVDIEWGLRAKDIGFRSFGVFSAEMSHSLGDSHVNFLGRKITIHSPLRHYYLVRNAFWLYKQRHVPGNWKFIDGYRMVLRMGFYTIFAKPRHRHFLMMLRGLGHGLRSRLGPYKKVDPPKS